MTGPTRDLRLAIVIAALACAAGCFGGDDDAPPPAGTATPATTAQLTTTPAEGTPVASGTASTGEARYRPGPNRAPPLTTRPPTFGTPASGLPRTGPIVFSPGIELTAEDLAARLPGPPGRGDFNIERIIIAGSGIDAPVTSAIVRIDGRMPDPPLDAAAWYDFSAWPSLGGLPGVGGNVVIAGVAIKPEGSGVFASLNAGPGDYVRLRLTDGSTVCYAIEFEKLARDDQVEHVVAATADESITLITGAAPPNRLVFWGRRASCASEPPPTPTRAPSPIPTDRHKVKIVAENNTFTVVEGAVVPHGMTAVDYAIDHRDAGVQHSLAIYSPLPRQVGGSAPEVGPIQEWTGLFGLGPPDPPGEYTFQCQIHPEMKATITVLP
jgi:hypothetical protein